MGEKVNETNILAFINYSLHSNYIYCIILPLVIGRTIQRRINNSVDFDRDWYDYVTGFGDVDGNFWLGLEEIHQLTTTHDVYNDLMFTTRDRDNDRIGINCASENNRGGWWYHSCGFINLNGNYEGDVTPTKTGIVVRYIDDTSGSTPASKAVKSVEMIIRTRLD